MVEEEVVLREEGLGDLGFVQAVEGGVATGVGLVELEMGLVVRTGAVCFTGCTEKVTLTGVIVLAGVVEVDAV